MNEELKKAMETIKKQEKEIERLNMYLNFYEELCVKQLKEIRKLNKTKILRK